MAESVESPELTETPEFKEAVKKAREELEATIRTSNQQHLEEERKKLEALYGSPGKPPQPPHADGKDFFVTWGEKHGLPPEAGLELAQGVVDYVKRVELAPLSQSQRRSELRAQRQDVRTSDPQLARLDDKYHDEVEKLLASVTTLHADSYAAALELVVGRHVKDVLEDDRKARGPEVAGEEAKPGPVPLPAAPKTKGKIDLTDAQKQRALQMGLKEEDFVEHIHNRIKSMKLRGFSEPAIRQQLGTDLGTLPV